MLSFLKMKLPYTHKNTHKRFCLFSKNVAFEVRWVIMFIWMRMETQKEIIVLCLFAISIYGEETTIENTHRKIRLMKQVVEYQYH